MSWSAFNRRWNRWSHGNSDLGSPLSKVWVVRYVHGNELLDFGRMEDERPIRVFEQVDIIVCVEGGRVLGWPGIDDWTRLVGDFDETSRAALVGWATVRTRADEHQRKVMIWRCHDAAARLTAQPAIDWMDRITVSRRDVVTGRLIGLALEEEWAWQKDAFAAY